MKKLIILALALILISLAGCGTTNPTAGGGATLPAYYVNATTGLDTNAGTQAAPFKSITKALTVASAAAVAANIYVAPGTYAASGSAVGNNAETFPLTLSNNINLIGDIANKGVGAAPTTIEGDGVASNYTMATGGLSNGTWGVVVVIPANVTGASIKGFNIGGACDYDIMVDKATATIDSNTTTIMPNAAGNDLGVFNTSTVVITNNVFSDDSWYVHLEIRDNAVVTVKNNVFSTAAQDSIQIIGNSTAATSPTVDMGTAGAPGGNTILGGAGVVGLYVIDVASTSTINVSGNTWQANVQGADAAGHYAAGLLISASTVPYTGGNNYSIENITPGNPGIQFYGTGAAAHPKKK